MNTAKRRFMTSLVAVMVIVALGIGATWAWFTTDDSVEQDIAFNIITDNGLKIIANTYNAVNWGDLYPCAFDEDTPYNIATQDHRQKMDADDAAKIMKFTLSVVATGADCEISIKVDVTKDESVEVDSVPVSEWPKDDSGTVELPRLGESLHFAIFNETTLLYQGNFTDSDTNSILVLFEDVEMSRDIPIDFVIWIWLDGVTAIDEMQGLGFSANFTFGRVELSDDDGGDE